LKRKLAPTTKNLKTALKNYLRIGSLAILALILAGGVVYPNYDQIKKANNLIDEIKNEEEKIQAKLNSLLLAQSSYPHYEELLNLTQKHLPNDPQVLDFMHQTTEIAQVANLSLQNFRFDAASTVNRTKSDLNPLTDIGLKQFVFSLAGTGTYSQIKTFSTALENGEREIRVTNLRIYQRGETEDDHTLSFNLNGQVFWK